MTAVNSAAPPAEPIRLPVRLRPVSTTSGTAAAWFIPGDDPELWLRELCAWGVPLDALELLVIPVSPRDPAPLGLFVIPPQSDATAPAHSRLPQPYRQIAERLYVPLDTELYPRVTDVELREWLVWDVQVMHPTVGMIGCNRAELRRIANLLTAPPPAAVNWEHAQPGVAVEARVRSVRPIAPPPIEQFLDESQDGIGADSPKELPPLPSESLINRAAAKGAEAGFRAVEGLASMLGGGSAGRPGAGSGGRSASGTGGWMRRLHAWANERRQALTKQLEEARQRELARLMKMLESNPDHGLRFALPLHGTGSNRGIGPRGGALPPRNTNFSFADLFSGAPADPWNLPPDTYQRLSEQYRALANRELNLGRFRRAAYIFANLLGDYSSAANALKQGRFFREAAMLYRDRLRNAQAAAACLEEGGLLAEAITEYEKLKQYEKVGDLQRRLKQEERAAAAYRCAVAAARDRGDILDAARLLELKLGAVDESLDLLTDAWPARPQATACLRAAFDLLGRVNRHDEAARRIATLRREPNPRLAQPLANVLADVATAYPSLDVRTLAADATRVVAGRRLPSAEPHETRALATAVARVAVDDHLLPRDTNRYVDQVIAASAATARARAPDRPLRPKALAPDAKSLKVSLDHAFVIAPVLAQWRTAVADGSTFYAQGFIGERVIVVQGTWDGQTRHVAWSDLHGVATRFRLEPMSATNLLAAPRDGARARPFQQSLPPKDAFAERVSVGCGSWLGSGYVYDVARDGALTWLLHSIEPPGGSELLLSAFDPSGHLRWSGATPIAAEDANVVESLAVRARGGYTFVTCGSVVHVLAHALSDQRWLPPIDLGRPIRSVTISPPHTRVRFVACFDEGGRVVWPHEQATEPFGASLTDPTACFTGDGLLVAVGRQRGIAYRMSGNELSLVSTFATRGEAPIAVTPAPKGFASFYSDGLVQVMTVT